MRHHAVWPTPNCTNHLFLVTEFKNSCVGCIFYWPRWKPKLHVYFFAYTLYLLKGLRKSLRRNIRAMQFGRLKILCLLLSVGVFISFQQWRVQGIIPLPQNKTIPAVIVFGDSVVDTGNNNYLPTISKVNYPPYGKDFMGGMPTGRYSNGKVPSDLLGTWVKLPSPLSFSIIFFSSFCCNTIAETYISLISVEELGIKEILPAYLDPNLQSEDLITGINFASGSGGYDPLTSEVAVLNSCFPEKLTILFLQILCYSFVWVLLLIVIILIKFQNVLSLSKQLELFQEYVKKLQVIAGEDRAATILSDSFYVLVTGSNDITNTYFSTPFRSYKYDISSYTDFMLGYGSGFIQVTIHDMSKHLDSHLIRSFLQPCFPKATMFSMIGQSWSCFCRICTD